MHVATYASEFGIALRLFSKHLNQLTGPPHYLCIMHDLLNLIEIISVTLTIITLIGLWRPWIVLWWLARQNRLMVLKWYGLAAVVCWGIRIAST